MLFQKPSTRTRVSFEAGMAELGGHAINLTAAELQLSRGETIEDTARTLSRYVDCILGRVHDHQDVERLAKAADAPVINGLSDRYHPCQALADLQTMREVKGRFQGLKVAWVGDGNNICNTLLVASAKMGISMDVACPEGYDPYPEALAFARTASSETDAEVRVLHDPETALSGADVVVTDGFVSMGKEEERADRLKKFLPRFQVNGETFARAKPDAVFMHCLPAHRGEEVTDEIIDGPRSVVWEEAENRLHAQKALLCLLLLREEELPWPMMIEPS